MKRSSFGGESRVKYGGIVTFEFPDGDIHVEHFTQLVHQTGAAKRVRHRTGDRFIVQAVARADELGAKILSISTPETILRDLEGTRMQLDPASDKKYASDQLPVPELIMLGRVGRLDLLVPPRMTVQTPSTRQVTTRRPTHRGNLSQ